MEVDDEDSALFNMKKCIRVPAYLYKPQTAPFSVKRDDKNLSQHRCLGAGRVSQTQGSTLYYLIEWKEHFQTHFKRLALP